MARETIVAIVPSLMTAFAARQPEMDGCARKTRVAHDSTLTYLKFHVAFDVCFVAQKA